MTAVTNLLGRRAVYTEIVQHYDYEKKDMVEDKRTLFHGEIVALVCGDSYSSVGVVLLYDSGGLRSHHLSTITVEARAEEPFR